MGQTTTELILASASPRRTELLTAWGIPHRVVPAEVDERLSPDLDRTSAVIDLAHQKAQAVRNSLRDSGHDPSNSVWVMGADTLVYLNNEPLGKPLDDDDARRMLGHIAGQPVDVITGVALHALESDERLEGASISTCLMRPFGADEIDAYVATQEPRDKAGSFAIQGKGGALVESLQGSRSNVIGLPEELVKQMLAKAGF